METTDTTETEPDLGCWLHPGLPEGEPCPLCERYFDDEPVDLG